MGGDLPGGLAGGIGFVGVGFRQQSGRAVLGDLLGNAPVAVVGVAFGDPPVGDGSHPVVVLRKIPP